MGFKAFEDANIYSDIGDVTEDAQFVTNISLSHACAGCDMMQPLSPHA